MNDLLIRPIQLADLAEVVEILNPFIVNSSVTFDTQPYTAETRIPWFEQFSERGRHQCLVAVLNGKVVGYANSSKLKEKAAYETSVEVSVYSNGPRGLGRKLYQALFDRLSQEDIHRIHALITLPNEASINLHHKWGFNEVGILHEAGRKFGQYYSVCWLEKRMR